MCLQFFSHLHNPTIKSLSKPILDFSNLLISSIKFDNSLMVICCSVSVVDVPASIKMPLYKNTCRHQVLTAMLQVFCQQFDRVISARKLALDQRILVSSVLFHPRRTLMHWEVPEISFQWVVNASLYHDNSAFIAVNSCVYRKAFPHFFHRCSAVMNFTFNNRCSKVFGFFNTY